MKNIKIWIGCLITIILLYIVFRKANFSQIVNSLKGAKYYYLIPSMLCLVISFYFRAIRWGYLLKPIKSVNVKILFPTMMIGFMATDVLPARIGEFVRAYIIGKKEDISKSSCFATVVIERLFDITVLLLFMLILFMFFHFPSWVKTSGTIVMVFLVVCLLVLFSLKIYFNFYVKLFNKVFFFISTELREKIIIRLQHFTFGLFVFKNPKLIFISLLYSFFIWMLLAVSVYFALLVFSLNVPLYVSLFVTIVIAVGIMVPSAPGFIGTYQFACLSALALFGVDRNVAVSFSIILHASQFFPVIIIGYLCMLKEHMTFTAISKMNKDDKRKSIS